jgi:hypothetical protein
LECPSPTRLVTSLSTTTGRSRQSAPLSSSIVCAGVSITRRKLTRSILFYRAGAANINPSVSRGDAIDTAERTLHGSTYNGHLTKPEFFVQPDGFPALTHVIQIRNETAGTWFEALVDAHNNTLLSVTDFVRKASVGSVEQLVSAFYYTVLRYAIHIAGPRQPRFL